MKKPQALFGLLAALGTAIGVLVAVVGLPYGRADYSAFAELYHDGTNTAGGTIHLAVDCDVSDLAVDDTCTYFFPLPATTEVNVTVGNETGFDIILGTFNHNVNHFDDTRLFAPPVAGGLDGNPDFIADSTNDDEWSCGPPAGPDNDQNPLAGDPGQSSFISCFNSPVVGTGPTIVDGGPHLPLSQVDYNIPLGAAAGTTNVSLTKAAVFDDSFSPVGGCNPGVAPCFSADIIYADAPTVTPGPTDTPAPPTNTPTVTNTPLPPTATNTATPLPEEPFIIKVPEQCSNGGDAADSNADCSNPLLPLANLFLCEPDGDNSQPDGPADGDCDGEGEGNLIVFEYAQQVVDSPEAGVQGLGAYEFSVEYDNFVIASVNPCDIVFGTPSYQPADPNGDPNNPGGADGIADGEGQARGPVNELDTSDSPYCNNDADPAPPGPPSPNSCAMSIVLENIVHFGCATSGQTPGPLGDMDLAALNLIPHEDLRNDIFPGNNNGVVTILKDNGCELVDTLGHPVPGSINGGLTGQCGDIAVTVRILEGDLDLDCDVDITDAQAIASHYGAFFGGLLYSKWLDLEPQFHDLDIDIKDVQKVFGRQGSTCQNPIPAQPPVPYN